MDIKDKIDRVFQRIKSDETFARLFRENPLQAIKDAFDNKLPDDEISEILDGVKSQVIESLKKIF